MSLIASLPSIKDKSKKRLGRGDGSKAGSKSGRGTKRHQKARENIPTHFEGGQNRMVKKFALLRGKSKNKVLHPQPVALALQKLSIIKPGTEVSILTLLEHNIISTSTAKKGVKIVNTGDITIPLVIQLPITASAAQKIEKAGGSIASL